MICNGKQYLIQWQSTLSRTLAERISAKSPPSAGTLPFSDNVSDPSFPSNSVMPSSLSNDAQPNSLTASPVGQELHKT